MLAMHDCVCVYVNESPALCEYMYYNLPGSSVRGIFHSRILERVAISFSKGSYRVPSTSSPDFSLFCTSENPGRATIYITSILNFLNLSISKN